MPHLPIALVHDSKGLLAPLTDLRASFDVRTGALTLRERVVPACVFVPPELEGITREVLPTIHGGRAPAPNATLVNEAPGGLGEVLVVNGRCPLPPVDSPPPLGHALVDEEAGDLILARVPGRDVARVAGGDLAGLTLSPLAGRHLITRPWHVRAFRDACMAHDLKHLCAHADNSPRHLAGVSLVGWGPLTNQGTICAGVVLDLTHGSIAILEHAVVRPGAVLIGPCCVGPHSTVLERATIRQHTAIGPWCKVNGEVGGTIFQGYANKAHDGYLGDSWVGEWVNLGAGTTNSNLLNTYGEIVSRATPEGKNERTGETFLGAVIGDHVKTAICTRIMTGSVLHTGSMFATTAPVSGCVGAFTWATDDPDTGRPGHRPYRLDKFGEVMRAAMARRKAEPSQAYLRRLAELHAQRPRP